MLLLLYWHSLGHTTYLFLEAFFIHCILWIERITSCARKYEFPIQRIQIKPKNYSSLDSLTYYVWISANVVSGHHKPPNGQKHTCLPKILDFEPPGNNLSWMTVNSELEWERCEASLRLTILIIFLASLSDNNHNIIHCTYLLDSTTTDEHQPGSIFASLVPLTVVWSSSMETKDKTQNNIV